MWDICSVKMIWSDSVKKSDMFYYYKQIIIIKIYGTSDCICVYYLRKFEMTMKKILAGIFYSILF